MPVMWRLGGGYKNYERRFDSLVFDLYQAFAEKAMSLLAVSHPSLVPSELRNDSSRIATLTKFVQSIPRDIYAAWGLPGYQEIIAERFVAVCLFRSFSLS